MGQNDTSLVAEDRHVEGPGRVVRELQGFLDATLRDVDMQIHDYPTPIPRCDAQFNHLYEQRACALRELALLRGAATAEQALRSVAAETLQHAPYGDSEIERRLRAHLHALQCEPDRLASNQP